MRRLALLRLAFSRRLDESLAALIRDAVKSAQAEQRASLGSAGEQSLASLGMLGPAGESSGVWVTDGRFGEIAQQVVSKNLASLADSISKQRG